MNANIIIFVFFNIPVDISIVLVGIFHVLSWL